MAYQIVELDTGVARINERIEAPGAILLALQVPADSAATVRIGGVASDPVPLRDIGKIESCERWGAIHVSNAAVAGERIILYVGDGDDASPRGGTESAPGALYDPNRAAAVEGGFIAVAVDELGRQYVRLGDRLDSSLDSITPVPRAYVQTAGAVAAGARLALALDRRRAVSWWAHLDAAGDAVLEGSLDGAIWRVLDTQTLAAAGDVGWSGTYAWPHMAVRLTASGTVEGSAV